MRTLRGLCPVGLVFSVVIFGAFALSGCGSSNPSSTTPSESASSSSSVTVSDNSGAQSSIPPAPSTLPPSLQAPCSALTSALAMSELHPRNAGNWPAERQRLITDTARNVELFTVAAKGVPEDVARALETLKSYSTWLGTTISASTSFDAAVGAVNAYPDLVGASLATSVVDTWKRKNC